MSAAHRFHPTFLREYDARGVVGETLAEDDARALGRAFGTRIVEAGGASVAVGRDGRPSSPALEAALVEGLAATGLEVRAIGPCPTPALYYAVHVLEAGGGVMVTGSHNPPEYNGFKTTLGTAPFYGADLQALGDLAARGAFASGAGRITAEPGVLDAWIARLTEDIAFGRPLSVVWDCGNGATGPAVSRLVRALPGRHEVLFAEVDGRFPNHHPDPTLPENLEHLRAAVARSGADLGVAFDGDGDRIGAVDEAGRIVWGDRLLAILAEDVLRARPGATVIADVKASQALFDRVAELGGAPLMSRTGHAPIKRLMAETGAPLAGEMSGHIFFADRYYGFDDALYAALRLVETVGRRDEPLSAIAARLPETVSTPELRFPCPEERKFAVVERVKAGLAGRRDVEVSEVDGARVRGADGWWLLRASNTQDALVARCESGDEAGLARLKAELAAALRGAGLEPPEL